MATTLVVWSEGQRASVKVTPMAPLSKVVEEACKALKPPRDPSHCQLLINKKQQELTTPVRYANIPNNAKLELHTGHQARLGVRDSPAEPSMPVNSSQASQLPASGATATNSSDADLGPTAQLGLPASGTTIAHGHRSMPPDAMADITIPHPPATTATSPRSQDAQPSALSSVSLSSSQGISSQTGARPLPAAPAAHTASSTSTQGISGRADFIRQHGQAPTQPSARSDTSDPSFHQGVGPQAAPSSQPAQPLSAPAAPSRPSFQMDVSSQAARSEPAHSGATEDSSGQSGACVQGVDRPLHVFRRPQAVADATADDMANAAEEPGDAFFELTQDDLHRMMAGFNRSSRAGDGQGLKTAKMREQEASQKADRLGPVPIRVHLPDGLILQASFQATEPLAALHSFVRACLLPGAPSWHLYTTPPKQVFKDLRPTLFQAGLVPAAIVYLGAQEPAAQSNGAKSHPSSSQEGPQSGHTTGSQEVPRLLRPEVAAVTGVQPDWRPRDQPGRGGEASRPGLSAAEKGKGKAAEGSFAAASTGEEKARKGPKWLKLGAK